MTTPRQEPGCRVAGKGLLISFQCGFLRLNLTLVTCSGQSPTLQMESVRSARQQALTPPKQSDPLTASLPGGASPVSCTVWTPAGSLLLIVMVAELGPIFDGWKRMGSGNASPGPTVSGSESTSGTMKSVDDEEMPAMESVQLPLLLRITGRSTNDPTHTRPQSPLSGTNRLRREVTPSPETRTMCGEAGSSLTMVTVPLWNPVAVGWKRMTTSVAPPASTLMGYESTLGARKAAGAAVMLEMSSGPVPLLSMVRISTPNDRRQTRPKLPLSAMVVTTVG